MAKAKLTHRLTLVDSNNRAVFIDIDIAELIDSGECYTAVSPLMEKYADLLTEDEAKVTTSIENDKKVAKVAKAKQAEKIKALPIQNEKETNTKQEQNADEDTGEFEENDR